MVCVGQPLLIAGDLTGVRSRWFVWVSRNLLLGDLNAEVKDLRNHLIIEESAHARTRTSLEASFMMNKNPENNFLSKKRDPPSPRN